MEETQDIYSTVNRQRLVVRVSDKSLSFSVLRHDSRGSSIVYEPYPVKSGISMAANLREALKTADLPAENYNKVMVLLDSPVLMMPVDLFVEDDMETFYCHAFRKPDSSVVSYNVLPDLNAVALFAVNKDLRMVFDDNFRDVKVASALTPVWRYLYQRSFLGGRNKLYGYFHEGALDIFSFNQNRFKYCNSFQTDRLNDSLYYLLCVWKQLSMNAESDEIHLVGDIPDPKGMIDGLHKYLRRAYIINPVADFNRAPATGIKGMQYDLITYFVKGR